MHEMKNISYYAMKRIIFKHVNEMKYVLNVYIEALSELKGALTSFAANSFSR